MGNACVDEEVKPLEVVNTYKKSNPETSKLESHPDSMASMKS